MSVAFAMIALHDVRRSLCTISVMVLAGAGVMAGPAWAGGLDVTQAQDGAADQPDGSLLGEFLGPGVECAQLRLSTGEQISIEGQDFSAIAPGTMLLLTGDFARMSRCMQGRALIVRMIERAPPQP